MGEEGGGARSWLQEGEKGTLAGWVPIGKRAMMRGTLGGPYLVGLGADTFVEMDGGELRQHLGEKMSIDPPPAVRVEEEEPIEIVEELSEQDQQLLESRGRPRIAHTPTHPGESTLTGSVRVPPIATSHDPSKSLSTLENDMADLRITGRPVLDRVVERRPPPTGKTAPPLAPSETILGREVKETLFRRATALTKPVRGSPGEDSLTPKSSDQ